jgi:ATP-dependent RNA helicase RhlE
MSFAQLGLCAPIVRAVSEHGYTEPTPIQAQAIPAVLAGRDVMGAAQTGTGKTAGFTLPILQRLTDNPARPLPGGRTPIRVLVLTPTRELAAQVEESIRTYGKHLQIPSMVMFGGVGINPQIDRLRRRVDILVATPGRLLDHVQQRTLDLSHVEILVLDEADRMLDMGFIRDIRRVLALLPKQKQTLLFSATFSDDIRALADGLLSKPVLVEVARRNATAELVEQKAIFAEKGQKRAVLSHLIRTHNWFQVLVFTRTKHGANRLAEQLGKDGITSLAIHGNKSQNARTRALASFKSGELQVLVATDIAARGLDIVDLPHVVNYELPNVPEDYVHRIGRTGRAGATGEAISLVDGEERAYLRDIERLIQRQIPRMVVEGVKPAPESPDRPAALPQRRSAQPQGRGEGQPSRNRGSGHVAQRQGGPGARREGTGAGGSTGRGGGGHRHGGVQPVRSIAAPAGHRGRAGQTRRSGGQPPHASQPQRSTHAQANPSTDAPLAAPVEQAARPAPSGVRGFVSRLLGGR